MLQRADRNEIDGACFILSVPGEGHETGIYGTYRADPDMAISVATRAMGELYTYAARKRIDPLTASEFMGR